MKRPDEIRKGLECGITGKCIMEDCPYYKMDTRFNPLDIDKEAMEEDLK